VVDAGPAGNRQCAETSWCWFAEFIEGSSQSRLWLPTSSGHQVPAIVNFRHIGICRKVRWRRRNDLPEIRAGPSLQKEVLRPAPSASRPALDGMLAPCFGRPPTLRRLWEAMALNRREGILDAVGAVLRGSTSEACPPPRAFPGLNCQLERASPGHRFPACAKQQPKADVLPPPKNSWAGAAPFDGL